MLSERREKFKKLENFFGKFFAFFPFTPNHYTFFGLFSAFFCFYFLKKSNFPLALLFFLVSASFDFIDGTIARLKKMVTKKGAYLDTIFDRYVEGIVLFGFLFLPLPDLILPAKFWIFLALFGSLMTTYSKAAAKEKELIFEELKKGFFGKGERAILIGITIFLGIFNPHLMIYPITILAIFSNLTALERIVFVLRS